MILLDVSAWPLPCGCLRVNMCYLTPYFAKKCDDLLSHELRAIVNDIQLQAAKSTNDVILDKLLNFGFLGKECRALAAIHFVKKSVTIIIISCLASAGGISPTRSMAHRMNG